MPRRRHVLLPYLIVGALAALPPAALARGKAKAGADSAARVKRLQRATNRLVSAIRRTRPLAGLVSKRVTVTYKTSDRAEGSFFGKAVLDAAKIDGVVEVKGMTGGEAWVPRKKKIKPRPKTVKLHVGKKAYELLKMIRQEGRRSEMIKVDKKDLTLYFESASESMIFKFREDKGAGMRVFELGYSNEDPG